MRWLTAALKEHHAVVDIINGHAMIVSDGVFGTLGDSALGPLT